MTALLRALIPGLAGMSGLIWGGSCPNNLLGGMIWATAVAAVAVLGYLAGASLAVAQRQLGVVSNIALGVLVVAALVVWLRSHVRRRQSRF